MGMYVNTNTAANNAYRNLSNTQTALNKSLEKLSSGLRINRAADDAAGLAISEGMKSQVGGLGVAATNAQDGINVVQTAEGGLGQAQSILQRLRDLSVQAASDSNNTDSRKAIQTEATSLVSELTRISGSTNFGGTQLLDGKAGTAGDGKLNFQVGANGDAASQISIDLSGSNVANIAKALGGFNADGGQLTAKADTGITIDTTAVAGKYTFSQADGNSVTVDFGAVDSTGRTQADVLATLKSQLGSSFSVSYDATKGYTVGSTDSTKAGAVTATAVDATTSAGLTDGSSTASTDTVDIKALDFSTAAGAQASITLLDSQITSVSTARATLGATQNRLESAIQTINISKENLSASESRITDTDMAAEMVNYTRSSILSQAGTAMLAQANQSNQGVLKLLQ